MSNSHPFSVLDGRPKTALPYGQKVSMSFQAMSWAVSQRCSNAGQKLVLLMLANYCNSHTGQCNPSHKRLADECSMGVSTLKNHLQALAECGLIEIVHKVADGVQLPNQYVLKLEGVGQNLADPRPESGCPPRQNLATNLEGKPGIEPVGGFDRFWQAWPKSKRKGGKPVCLTIWKSKNLDDQADAIIAHVKAMCASEDWRKQGGEYIPAPATYLRGMRWDGAEVEPSRQKTYGLDVGFGVIL